MIALTAPPIALAVDEEPVPRPLALRVMTFNLKYASEKGANPWSQRRRLVREVILSQAPDVIGTQEGLYTQLRDIAADLPAYGWLGQGRQGEHRGEFSAILYHRERFRVLDQGNFWLSSTPEVIGSRTWGNLHPRMVSWALFEERASGTRFYHYNTHFDHLIPYARSKSAELLARRIAGRKLSLPVIVTGDFNTAQNGRVHSMLTARAQGGATVLVDTWATATAHDGRRLSTLHHWRGPSSGGRRIDWILTTADFACRKTKVVTYQEGGRWPSDHFPVVSDLKLGAPAREILLADRQTSSSVALR